MKLGDFESPGMCDLDGFDIYCVHIYIYAIAQKRITTDGLIVEAALATEIVKQRHCSHVCWRSKLPLFPYDRGWSSTQ